MSGRRLRTAWLLGALPPLVAAAVAGTSCGRVEDTTAELDASPSTDARDATPEAASSVPLPPCAGLLQTACNAREGCQFIVACRSVEYGAGPLPTGDSLAGYCLPTTALRKELIDGGCAEACSPGERCGSYAEGSGERFETCREHLACLPAACAVDAGPPYNCSSGRPRE